MAISTIYVVAALLLSAGSFVFLVAPVNSASQQRRRHPHLFDALPIVGVQPGVFSGRVAAFKSVRKTGDWVSEGYVKFTKRGVSYLISTWDKGLVVMLPTEQLKRVYRLPEDRLDVFGTLQDQIQARYTIPNQRVILEPYHRHLIPNQLNRNLDEFTSSMVAEIEDQFNISWGTGRGWHDIALWHFCFQVIARASNSALIGFPLCRNDEYLKLLEGQSLAVHGGSTLINVTPEFLRPVIGYLVRRWSMYYSKAIGKICIAHIEKRIQDATNTHSEPGTRLDHKDGLQTIIDHAISTKDPTQLSPDLISERLLITNNVTLHGLTFTLQNLILNLVSTDPSHGYIETLRDECRRTLSGAAGKWNLEAVWKLKLLDSAIRESMRITPFSSMAMARTVIDPEGITVEQGDSNIIIPHGTLLALPVERIHMDQDRYQNPYEFNPFRFVSFSSQDDKKPKDQDYTTTKATTTPDDQFFYFGTTKNPCPGRFFAVYQLKLVMAHLLLNYDLEYSSKKVNLSDMLAMKVPQMDAKLRVRKLD